jgi:putative hydrolase of the HAD superfamily
MIKAVIFDIDNTMYDYDAAHAIAMDALTAHCTSTFSIGKEECPELCSKAQRMVEDRIGMDCAAIHNRLLRFQCILELLHIEKPSCAMTMYHVYWDNLIAAMKAEPGLKELISALHSKKIPIGVGSDMTAYIQYKKLEKLQILDEISQIVTSEEAGAEKPAPRFFQLCVEKMGCRPEECVFIGDSLKKDVKGAIENGLQGVWYHPYRKGDAAETKVPCIRSFEEYAQKCI